MQALTSTPDIGSIRQASIQLLQDLIAIPSFSKEENGRTEHLHRFLVRYGITCKRKANNIWALNKYFDPARPTLLLNSHLDTVKPNAGWSRDPFMPQVIDGKLYGLGSNDAGASLVSLLGAFLFFYQEELDYNLAFCASAEEEISGTNGIACLTGELPKIDLALVGEPTNMNLAVAEKGLLVLDCVAYGQAGHAARQEGDNAIYKAVKDIEWFRNFKFSKASPTLGETKMSVTQIQAGTQHNVVPATCSFVVDVRPTEVYTNEEVLEIVKANTSCEVTARSTRLKATSSPINHPFIKAAVELGRKTYGSPTLSDQALMPWPSVKIGPGESARSHSADEFVFVKEVEDGIGIYIDILTRIVK